MTYEDLQAMRGQLQSVSAGVTDRAEISNLEEDFVCKLVLQKTGSINVQGVISPRIASFATLTFSFESDLATADRSIKELSAIMRAAAGFR